MFNPFKLMGEGITSFNPPKGSLTDIKRANRAFKEINSLVENERYSFQPEIESKKGAKSIIGGIEYDVLSSYDYLGLIGHPEINLAAESAIAKFGTGTGGVRLMTGTNSLHLELEREIAAFKGKEAALSLSSGYMANLAIATTFIGKNGKVFADEKIHRSFVDALSLAGADLTYFLHNDYNDLRNKLLEDISGKRRFIISEGVFSMDGDICPLPELVQLKNEFKAYLIIDEAHSFGVLGENGRGVDEHFGIDPNEIDIVSGSLSKAIPATGGFILANSNAILFLQHECAPFIFSGALCPPAVGAALSAIEILKNEKWRLSDLRRKSEHLNIILKKNGFETGSYNSPVIPIRTGDYIYTFELFKHILNNKILVSPVIFPAVPANASIIRLCASTYHTPELYEKFDELLEQFKERSN
jgi:8-amino-7-oxononanoate synthase